MQIWSILLINSDFSTSKIEVPTDVCDSKSWNKRKKEEIFTQYYGKSPAPTEI